MRTLLLALLIVAAATAADAPKPTPAQVNDRVAADRAAASKAETVALLKRDIAAGEKALAVPGATVEAHGITVARADLEKQVADLKAKLAVAQGRKVAADSEAEKAAAAAPRPTPGK